MSSAWPHARLVNSYVTAWPMPLLLWKLTPVCVLLWGTVPVFCLWLALEGML